MIKRIKLRWLLFSLLLLTGALAGCGGVEQKRKGPDQLYEEGMQSLKGRKTLFFTVPDYERAQNAFEEIKSRFSFTTYAPLAELRLADIHFKKEEYADAVIEYSEFIKLHPGHEEIPYAIYRLGLSYFHQMRGIDRDQTPAEEALAYFETLIQRFPESEYAKEASEKADKCRESLAGHEFYVGLFYYKQENYNGAIERFKKAIERYPGYGPKKDALLYLGRSYIYSGEHEKGREVLEKIRKIYPESKQGEEAAEIIDDMDAN